jgi:hypothetical protein
MRFRSSTVALRTVCRSEAMPQSTMHRLPGPLRFARMAGSSIAGPSAAGWVTDFVNAAYYAWPEGERSVQDLRLAHGIIATRCAQLGGRRLGAPDALMLHRAYGRLRLRDRGRLTGATLLQGAERLIGEWFSEAWADPDRRADSDRVSDGRGSPGLLARAAPGAWRAGAAHATATRAGRAALGHV